MYVVLLICAAYVYTCIFWASECLYVHNYMHVYLVCFCVHACIYFLYANCNNLILQARAINLHREDLGCQLCYNPVPPRNTFNIQYGDTYNFYINDTRPQVKLCKTDQFEFMKWILIKLTVRAGTIAYFLIHSCPLEHLIIFFNRTFIYRGWSELQVDFERIFFGFEPPVPGHIYLAYNSTIESVRKHHNWCKMVWYLGLLYLRFFYCVTNCN